MFSRGMKWLTSSFFVRDLELSRYTKIFRKIKISNPMIYTLKSAYQGVRNVSFPENFAYVLTEWSVMKHVKSILNKSWIKS